MRRVLFLALTVSGVVALSGCPAKPKKGECKTSADCAHLGAGYFCDTPDSGCCSDHQLQRCIAPCPTSDAGTDAGHDGGSGGTGGSGEDH